jgi:hypothetical protein
MIEEHGSSLAGYCLMNNGIGNSNSDSDFESSMRPTYAELSEFLFPDPNTTKEAFNEICFFLSRFCHVVFSAMLCGTWRIRPG